MANGRPQGRVLAALLTLASPALAAEGGEQEGVEGRVEEFFFGEEAPPNQKHELEAGSGLEWEQDKGEANFEVPMHLEYGLSDRLQFQGEVEVSPPGDDSRLEAGRVGARWALVNDGAHAVTVSLGAEALAVRDAPEASLRPGLSPFLVAYKDLGPLGVNASARAEVLPASGGRDGTVHPDLGAALVLDGGVVRPMVEAAFRNEEGTNTGILAPGVYLRPSKALEVGVAVPWRLRPDGERSLGVSALLTWSGGGSN